MTIANALRAFFNVLNGTEPTGDTIEEVIRNGTASVSRNNESAVSAALETAVTEFTAAIATTNENVREVTSSLSTTNETVTGLNLAAVKYEDSTNKSFVLNSSTVDSVKSFRITVTDAGILTATEIVA